MLFLKWYVYLHELMAIHKELNLESTWLFDKNRSQFKKIEANRTLQILNLKHLSSVAGYSPLSCQNKKDSMEKAVSHDPLMESQRTSSHVEVASPSLHIQHLPLSQPP